MNLIYTVLVALPLGFFIGRRGLAMIVYVLAGTWVLGFQHVAVILAWLANDQPIAFGPSPMSFPITYDDDQYAGYVAANLAITVVGLGLVALGVWLKERRRTPAQELVDA